MAAASKAKLRRAGQHKSSFDSSVKEQEIVTASYKGNFIRKQVNMRPDLRQDLERTYGTRTGVLNPITGEQKHGSNAYCCILQSKKLLARLKTEVTQVDKIVADAKKGLNLSTATISKGEGSVVSDATTDSFFLTSFMDQKQPPRLKRQLSQPIFLPSEVRIPRSFSKPGALCVCIKEQPCTCGKKGLAFARASSQSSLVMDSITSSCELVEKATNSCKEAIKVETKFLKDRLHLFARQINVLETFQQRRKYFQLRQQFQAETRVGYM